MKLISYSIETLTVLPTLDAKFTFAEKIFREINYLVTPLEKTLVSRNFGQDSVTAVRKSRTFTLTEKIISQKRCFHEIFAKKV